MKNDNDNDKRKERETCHQACRVVRVMKEQMKDQQAETINSVDVVCLIGEVWQVDRPVFAGMAEARPNMKTKLYIGRIHMHA